MSHTNHRRRFVAYRFNLGQRTNRYHVFGNAEMSVDGQRFSACSSSSGESSKIIRRSRAGAKKFVHSRRRRADRDALRQLDKDAFDIWVGV